jgi:hypothetical protein
LNCAAFTLILPDTTLAAEGETVTTLVPVTMAPLYVAVLTVKVSEPVAVMLVVTEPAPFVVMEALELMEPAIVVDAEALSVTGAEAVIEPVNGPPEFSARMLAEAKVMAEFTAPVPVPLIWTDGPLVVMEPPNVNPFDGARVSELVPAAMEPTKEPLSSVTVAAAPSVTELLTVSPEMDNEPDVKVIGPEYVPEPDNARVAPPCATRLPDGLAPAFDRVRAKPPDTIRVPTYASSDRMRGAVTNRVVVDDTIGPVVAANGVVGPAPKKIESVMEQPARFRVPAPTILA